MAEKPLQGRLLWRSVVTSERAAVSWAQASGEKEGVYAVDTWTNLAMSEGPRDTYREFIRNTRALSTWIVPLRGMSTDVAAEFDQEIDILFIDGDHSYEVVRADLEAWLPKVKDRGFVVLHDWGWAEGVRKAYREMVRPLEASDTYTLPNMYATRIRRART